MWKASKNPTTWKTLFRSFQFTVYSLQFSCSVVSDSLPTPWTAATVHYELLELTQTHVHGVGDAIQPSHPLLSPFSSHLQSFLAPGSFPMSQFFASCGQSIGASVSASVLPMNIQDWFPLGWIGLISLQSLLTLKSLLQHHNSKASICNQTKQVNV